MIRLSHVSKTFFTKKGKVEALKDVSLEVNKGEIFGIIGHSGAGKSTLIRTINLLEKPTNGTVTVNGVELTQLPVKKLKEQRRKIGMIFQGFNLLKTATVYENVAIPLWLSHVPLSEIHSRMKKYLRMVGLEEKQNSYPSELSGGQKQRVAIARALAHEPEVLLSDEATSALDPETTESILDLLSHINRELGITIVLITHEMNVIQRLCDRVAVLENGEIVETGNLMQIFSAPKHSTTKKFVNSLFHQPLSPDRIKELERTGTLLHLISAGESGQEPWLSRFNLPFEVQLDLLAGQVTQLKNQPFARWLIHLRGSVEERQKAIRFLENKGFQLEGGNVDGVRYQRIS